ncbi:MAG TPA: ATP-dependent Clp protease ATP-binding subunit ClpX, partial [Bacteroidales bacterium]|nr:ATP-dependent Clp protease ATP-binding subunit ClpX [Bacteroidales bacterium]
VRANAIGYGLRTGDEIDRDNLLQYIAPQDLKSYGLIPELVGRLPVLTYLDPLNRKVLRSILTDPKNAIIKQYVRLFEMDNIELKIDEKVFDFIVDRAIEFKLGARGLRSICEMIMLDAMFEVPTSAKKADTFEITLEYAENKISKTQMRKLKVA